MSNHDSLIQTLARCARPLTGHAYDFDHVLDRAQNARLVLIGEASHGTHEFYRLRAQLTQRLIAELGFGAVAAEADWPDAYRVNKYVMGVGPDRNAAQALSDFKRFPAWMWRNTEVLDFVNWLRTHNDNLPDSQRVGFYGVDLYSLHASIGNVLSYVDQLDPALSRRARERYACFEGYSAQPERYGYATTLGMEPDCEQAVLAQLIELRGEREAALLRGGLLSRDEHFQAEQNARVVLDAERYYRTMFGSSVESWNVRDTHMADTIDSLLEHLEARFSVPKVVVWAHNSHVGDARATELGESGELNIGQLARERHPDQTLLIGFSTHSGTVTAASNWGANVERKQVLPGLADSYEDIFHRFGVTYPNKSNFILETSDLARDNSTVRHLQRAIGVVYKPETERQSHYFIADVARQFDFMIHVDRTRALRPLDRLAPWDRGELPETFPSGL